jgi:hypothetical protein
MKYIWLMLATLLTPVILLLAAAWLLYQPGPPPVAQELLAGYLSLHNRTRRQPEAVQSLVRSLRPGAFAPELSHITYSDSGYFGATYFVSGSPGDPASRPAPFPPTDLWCATLAAAPDGDAHTVLLALHDDLYVGAWIVHEPTAEAAAQSLCR